MDARFSAEQQELRTSAARAVDQLGPHQVAALDDADRRGRLLAAVTRSGWHELRVGVEDGRPLASAVEAAIVAEELGRGLADVAFVGPTLAADLRRRCGAPAASALETVALDPGLGSLATAEGDEPPAAVAFDAGGAAGALVLRSGATGPGLGRLALRPTAVQMDLTRPCAQPDPSSPVSVVASESAPGPDDLAAWTALGLALTCADLVGVMRGAISLACDYAATRRQYDTPVGSFQAVQHMLADAHVAMEGSRSVALHAAWAVDALAPADALAAASVAKAYCGRAARRVCETSVQVHGGIGNTWDCLAHVYLRRALLSIDTFGGPAANVRRVLAHNGIGEGHGLR